MKAGLQAAGAVLYYVKQTQKQASDHLTRLESYSLNHYLMLDETSCRNLEILENLQNRTRRGTLLGLLDRTVTAMGGRLIKNWVRYPLLRAEVIEARHDAVQQARERIHLTRQIRDDLKSVSDLERLGSKICMDQANARDLLALKRSLQALPKLLDRLAAFCVERLTWKASIDPLIALADLIAAAIREEAPPVTGEGGMIRPGCNARLDELIAISRDGKGWLARLEADERQATGIQSLKVRYNKVFGYYIEVPKTRGQAVPLHYVRKQTLVNAERYITEPLKAFEEKVLGAEERRAKLELELFQEIRRGAAALNDPIQRAARFLAEVDCLTTLAEVAETHDHHRPEINTDGELVIEEGRHPVVEKMIPAERFVPNSIRLDNREQQVLVITGPNMAGKSTVLRQVALTVIMTQMGAFVPAKKASIAISDRIFTRVGALDNLSQGQSTFMVEMQETAKILHHATDRSLVIMDEIGRGTSTFDGMSIAWAVAEHLHDLNGHGVKTLFATHYHELTELSATKPRIRNFHIAVKEWNEEIIFLRKLVAGGTNRSYGIQVARLAGIPAGVIQRARQILLDLENRNPVLEKLGSPEPGKTGTRQGPVQLKLFQNPGRQVVDQLKKLDLSTTTPLEALNILSDLQAKAMASTG